MTPFAISTHRPGRAPVSFEPYSAFALLETLQSALRTYKNRPVWRRLQVAGMGQDFSWAGSARKYAAAYERATIGI